jgi:uncharacterized membrane protein
MGSSGGLRLRRVLVAGLLATGPLVVTAYVLWIVFSWVDGLLQPLFMRMLHFHVPGLGFLALLALVLLTGLFASHFVGGRIVRALSARLERLPLWSPIYRAVKDIGEVLLGDRSRSFHRVAAIEFPRPGCYALVFVTSEDGSPVDATLQRPHINVFLPSTPNPTTGFYLMVPPEQLVPLDLTIEQAVKLILSGGAAAGLPEMLRAFERAKVGAVPRG